MSKPSVVSTESRVVELGREILTLSQKHKSRSSLQERFMEWALSDQAFKVQLFRFVDVLPVLQSGKTIHEHLVEYLTRDDVKAPPGLATAIKAGGLMKGALAKTVNSQIEGMAKRFIAGTDAASALPLLRDRWKRGIAFSVDLLGEACVSDSEAAVYRQRYLDLIDGLADRVSDWPANETLERDHLGALPRANVSIKISSLAARVDPIDHDATIERLTETLGPILTRATERGVTINFDIESHDLKDFTYDLFMRCCERYDFDASLAMQAYLRSGEEDARRVIDWAKRSGRLITVRLVKGAYWDYEVIHAQEHGWPIPVWTDKPATDACFERMATRLIDATPRQPGEGGVRLAMGSHNVRSVSAALAHAESIGLPSEALEWQMLYGMGDELKAAAQKRGLRVREYLPVGELVPGMAYLVRRLLENTSNQSWLLSEERGDVDPAALLAKPEGRDDAGAQFRSKPLAEGVPGVGDGSPFYTEPFRDFADSAQRSAFARAIAGARVESVANDSTVNFAMDAVGQADAAFCALA